MKKRIMRFKVMYLNKTEVFNNTLVNLITLNFKKKKLKAEFYSKFNLAQL